MKYKRTITITAITIALAISAAFGIFRNATPVMAQDETSPPPNTDRISFGMVGITTGQTMRINVANIIATNDSVFPPGPTSVAIIVVNSRGNVARNSRGEPIRRVVQLERGDSTFLDVDYDQLPPGPSRAQLRAVVTVQYPEGTELPADIGEHKPFMPSVEVINNANGRTQFAVFTDPSVVRGFTYQ